MARASQKYVQNARGIDFRPKHSLRLTLFDDLFNNPIEIKEALKGLGLTKPVVHLIRISFFVGGV